MGNTECRSDGTRAARNPLADNTELGSQTHSGFCSQVWKSHKCSLAREATPSAYTKPHFHAELRARLDPAAATQGFDCHNATAWKTRVLFLILFLFFYSFSLRRRKKKSPKISSLGFHIKAWRTRGENEWKFQLALHQPSFVPLTNVYFAVSSHIAVRWRAHFQLAYRMARVANFILEGTAFESKEKQCATRSLSRSWRSECVTVAG